MRIVVLGAGGVGSSAAAVAARRSFFERTVPRREVLGSEAFPAEPFLVLLADYGAPHGVSER